MPRNDDKLNRPRRKGQDDTIDFGEFVSRNVQRTSDMLKGDDAVPQGEGQQQPASERPDGNRTVERTRDKSYWRRKAASAGVPTDDLDDDVPPPPPTSEGASRNRYLPPNEEEIQQFHDENEFADQGGAGGGFGGFGAFFADNFSGDGEDANRNRIIAAVVAIILILLLIFGLTRIFGGGDDSDDEVDPTPIPTETIQSPATPPAEPEETVEPESTEEPEIPRGGDNQRGDSGGDDPSGEASAVATLPDVELTSEIARTCSGLCLVRMVGEDQDAALDEVHSRASWAEGDISWVVVTPEQAEILQRTHELTLVENDPQTYNLYLVKTTEDGNQREVISPHGEIIDESGPYFLVRWSSVPAVVKPVTDWGYAVFKIAPAPPSSMRETGENGPLRNTDGGTLMGQVREENVERIMYDLSHLGEVDDTGYGSRYYTLPGNQIAADYLYQELESYGLEVWYEDFIMWDGYLLVNVVAEIPGSDDSEVYAMIAHLDSINNDDPRIAPGADDNASGMAVTLETARILSSYELEHPIQIAFVNAEEVGIVGAPAWARTQNANGIPIEGVFNIDSVASIRNRPVVITNADSNSAWMQQLMTRVNDEYGLQESFDHHQSTAIVADDNYVRDEGIPAVMVARELYGLNEYHHTNMDTMENVSVGGVVDTTNLIMLCLFSLVQ